MEVMLKAIYGNKMGWCVISHEDHEPKQDDQQAGVHRHVMIECCKPFDTKNPRFWDLKGTDGKVFHPHYETPKKKVAVLQYTIKDGNYIQFGTYKTKSSGDLPFDAQSYIESTERKKGYTTEILALEIKKGATIDELNDKYPAAVFRDKRKIEEYTQLCKDIDKRRKVKPQFPGFKVPVTVIQEDPHIIEEVMLDWIPVVDWINNNFLEARRPRQKQLWLWSKEPGLGKSWPFLIMLREFYDIYEWTAEEKQDAEIADADYIVFDDFTGYCTISQLKRLSQMYGTPLPIKMGKRIDFKKNVPLIITSNEPPEEVYKNSNKEHVKSLVDRFQVIEVTTKCNLQLKIVPTPPVPPTQVLPEPEPEPLPQPQPDNEVPEDKEDVSYDSEDEDNHLTNEMRGIHWMQAEEESSEDFEDLSVDSKMEWLRKHSKNLLSKK